MSNTLDLKDPKLYNPNNYNTFDDNLADMLIDALAGDKDLLNKPEIQSLGINNIKAALQWLKDSDVNGDYKELLLNEGWRLMYKRRPPSPEEFLTTEWIGAQAESLWPNVRRAFIEFMNPNPLNPKRGLALSVSIGWGKDQSIDSDIVVDKNIELELENGKKLNIPSTDIITVIENGKEIKIQAKELLQKNLDSIDLPQPRIGMKIKKVENTYIYKKLKDIKVGDSVLSTDDIKVKVLGIQKNGLRDVYKITLSDGRYFYTSETHNSLVHFRNSYTRPNKKVYDVLTTKYIKDHLDKYLFEIPTDDTFSIKELDFIQHLETLPVHEYEPVDDQYLIPDLKRDPKKVYIQSIEKLDEQKECWCLNLNDPMGLYLTEQGIITHNSLLTNLCMAYILTLFCLMREPYKLLGHSPMTSYSQPYGTLIQLKDNTWKPIECLIIGDELKPLLSEESIVTNIIDQGKQDTYELDFGNNKKVKCSIGHWWLVWDFKQNNYVKIQTKDFIKDIDRYGVPELEDLKKDKDLIIECNKQFNLKHFMCVT